MYGYLPWYYYFVTIIINIIIIIINPTILDIDVFSPAGNQHQVNVCFIIIIIITLISDAFIELANKHAPVKKKRILTKPVPFMNKK